MKLQDIITHETTILLDTVLRWVPVLLFSIPKVLDSNLSPETDYLDFSVSWYFPVSPQKFQASAPT
jgi:hypothetical protein